MAMLGYKSCLSDLFIEDEYKLLGTLFGTDSVLTGFFSRYVMKVVSHMMKSIEFIEHLLWPTRRA